MKRPCVRDSSDCRSQPPSLNNPRPLAHPGLQVGDHQSLVASLRQSAYYHLFKDEVASWEGKLAILQVGAPLIVLSQASFCPACNAQAPPFNLSLVNQAPCKKRAEYACSLSPTFLVCTPRHLQEGLVLLNQIQRKWVYLEPIFGRGALPAQQARFRNVDEEFRRVMGQLEVRMWRRGDHAHVQGMGWGNVWAHSTAEGHGPAGCQVSLPHMKERAGNIGSG